MRIHRLIQTNDSLKENYKTIAELNSKNLNKELALDRPFEYGQIDRSEQINELEKELNRTSRYFSTDIKPISIQDIKSNLTDKEACIEFVFLIIR